MTPILFLDPVAAAAIPAGLTTVVGLEGIDLTCTTCGGEGFVPAPYTKTNDTGERRCPADCTGGQRKPVDGSTLIADTEGVCHGMAHVEYLPVADRLQGSEWRGRRLVLGADGRLLLDKFHGHRDLSHCLPFGSYAPGSLAAVFTDLRRAVPCLRCDDNDDRVIGCEPCNGVGLRVPPFPFPGGAPGVPTWRADTEEAR